MGEIQLQPEKWVDLYGDYLYNYTISRVSDMETAQDLISDTFLAALGSMANFKGEASERTWLISILKRKIVDHYRKGNSPKGQAEVRMNFGDRENDESSWLEERVKSIHADSAEDRIDNDELGRAIYDCMEQLEERSREIFRRKTIERYDTEAICKEFNISSSNLWVIIHRARKAMVSCMEKSWFS